MPQNKHRDQTHRVEHVEYPGGMIKGIGGWSESYDQSVAIGISRLEARIAEEESNCGGSSNFVLLGYSQGARIVGDVASNIDSGRFVTESRDLASRVVVILYADPRQPETEIEVALAGVRSTSGITFTGERQPFSVVQVTWVCAPTDGVCDSRKPLGVDTSMGYMTTHTNY
ncbi:PE-PPE domain-containing protein [Rhodococcus erythropolis]|uniref:PE-PPE domain-containing protein n=1 Tax=Rhodococcus erythropolis TaxID=1833 RepID=UPI00374FC6F1